MDELGVLAPRRADARVQTAPGASTSAPAIPEDNALVLPAAEASTSKSSKRKRKRGSGPRLNDLQRLEIIRRRQATTPPVSLRQLAREYSVDEKTVRRVVAASAAIEERTAASSTLGRRHCAYRRATPKFPQLERALAAWIDARERARVEISPSVVIDKAKSVARGLGIPPTVFKASWGWYDKFCRRYGLRTAFVGNSETSSAVKSGLRPENEAVGASSSKLAARETPSLAELHAIMGTYDPELVFIVDETALFYDQLPFANVLNTTYSTTDGCINGSTSSGVAVDATGPRAAGLKKRVTLVVCCNSTGRLRPPVCMVGKETWPLRRVTSTKTADANQRFPLPYLEQCRAWLDRASFGRWFTSVFLPFVRQRSDKRVLLLVDGTRPGHQGGFEQDGVRVAFLPPPTTSTASTAQVWWAKPLDMGVLTALKARYKLLLVQTVLGFHGAPEDVKQALRSAERREEDASVGSGVHFGRPATLVDAARLVARAWRQIPPDLLENCFSRANLVPPSKLLVTPASASEPYTSASEPYTSAYEDSIAREMEKIIADSSIAAQVPVVSERGPVNKSVSEKVKTFLGLDDERSSEFQAQLRVEIDAVLHEDVDAGVMTPTTATGVPTPRSQGTETRSSDSSDERMKRQRLMAETRSLLLGATEVATKLRLLLETGAQSDVPVPDKMEDCITAADEIRQTLQTFDASLHAARGVSTTSPRPQETPLRSGTGAEAAKDAGAAQQTLHTMFTI